MTERKGLRSNKPLLVDIQTACLNDLDAIIKFKEDSKRIIEERKKRPMTLDLFLSLFPSYCSVAECFTFPPKEEGAKSKQIGTKVKQHWDDTEDDEINDRYLKKPTEQEFSKSDECSDLEKRIMKNVLMELEQRDCSILRHIDQELEDKNNAQLRMFEDIFKRLDQISQNTSTSTMRKPSQDARINPPYSGHNREGFSRDCEDNSDDDFEESTPVSYRGRFFRYGRGGTGRQTRQRQEDPNATITTQHLILAGKPKLPSYDGKGSWKPFITQFETHATLGGWDEQQRKTMMLLCLQGDAAEFFTMLIDMNYQFEEIKRRLEQRYGKRELPQTLRSQFHQIKQNSDESIFEWAERVQKVGFEAFRDYNLNQEYVVEEMVRRFCQGCFDKETAQYVSDKNPRSIDEALHMMRLHEFNSKAIYGHKKVRQVTHDLSQPEVRQVKENKIENVLEKVVSKLDELLLVQKGNASLKDSSRAATYNRQQSPLRSSSPVKGPFRSRSPSPRSKQCFYCGDTGHFIKNCPNKDKSPARKCYFCGGNGHYSAKCPEKQPASPLTKVRFADSLNSKGRSNSPS